MARIEDLIDEIGDADLREQIARQVKLLKSTKRFGLVFEDHVPETVSLSGLAVRPGLIVQNRRAPNDSARYRVLSVEDEKATIVPVGLDEPVETVAPEDLLVVKAFEEPIFPGLTPVGEVRRGPDDKPAHTVINGENFHALQLLAYTHANKVDVIYLDPPYNTGARDWKYNNRFVDNNDAWRHSKWLAMMEKRLRLSKKLLKPDGVLVVTIDEHEVHHLGMLLEDLFPFTRRQMVTIVINPAGVSQETFARVEEYAAFVFLGESRVDRVTDDMLSGRPARRRSVTWDSVLRRGTNALPSDRPNLVYPVAIDPETGRIVGTGRSLKERMADEELGAADLNEYVPDRNEELDGYPVTWPIRSDGSLGNWRLGTDTLVALAEEGFVRAGSHDPQRGIWPLSYLGRKDRERIEKGEIIVTGQDPDTNVVTVEYRDQPGTRPKTVWNRPAHNAGTNGADLIRRFLGGRAFSFPKSLYAVSDVLATIISTRPSSVVLDYFAGSGTTLHAAALLNARDGGNRQCILVTNNDVSETDAKRLHKAGHFAGDSEYEAEGIFESVTKPRVKAAISGVRPDGEPVEGKYLDQYLADYSYADGFEENVAFFRMDYLEPDLVELGRQYNAIAPLLWMAAGSVGNWEEWDGKQSWSAPANSTYGVLLDLAEATAFSALVEGRPEITNVWVVTDSHTAFVEVREELPADVEVGQLYREYLRNFTVNSPGVLD